MVKQLGKRKVVRDLSANSVQTLVTQVFGLVFFYVSSRYLDKEAFGEFSWSQAVGATLVAIGSLGLDLIFVRRMASGKNVVETAGIHFFHTILSGAVLCTATWLLQSMFPVISARHPVLLITFIYLSANNIANSFRLGLNGLEAYGKLARLVLAGNLLRLLLLLLLFFTGNFTVRNLIFIYCMGAIFEMGVGYFLLRNVTSHVPKPLLRPMEYKYFILESLPQLGVVLFDSALARIDWILLGILGVQGAAESASAMTAEYSFTYKVFEVSKLPLLVIAPVLLTRFSKMMSDSKQLSDKQQGEIGTLFNFEIFILMLMPLLLVSLWNPLVDYFTDGKYGAVNETTFRLLALCIPMHGIINFLWTIGFVQNQLKQIMFITIATSLINVGANIVLIPLYGSNGAALAFLFSTLIQLVLYIYFTRKISVPVHFNKVFLLIFFAGVSVLPVLLLDLPIFSRPLVVFVLFVSMSLLSRAVSIRDALKNLRR